MRASAGAAAPALAALVGAALGPGLGAARAADADADALLRLGRAKHLERFHGDLDGAAALYEGLLAELGPGSPLRAEVCYRLVAARLRRGAPEEAVARAASPLRELRDRHRAGPETAAAELLLEAALAWSDGGEPGGPAAVVRAVDPVRGSLVFAAGREAGVELGGRVAVVRAGRRVGRAVVIFAGRGLSAAALVDGEVAELDEVALPPATVDAGRAASRDRAAPPRVERGFLAEARALLAALVGEPGSGAAAGAPGAQVGGAGEVAPGPSDLDVYLLATDAATLADLGLRFEPIQPIPGLEGDAEAEGVLEAGAGAGAASGALALLGDEALARLLGRLDGAAGGGPAGVARGSEGAPPVSGAASRRLHLVRPRQPLDLAPGEPRQLVIGTWRLPAGDSTPRFEGVALRLERAPAGAAGADGEADRAGGPPARDALDRAVLASRADLALAVLCSAIDLPRAAVALPGAAGPLHIMVPAAQRVRGIARFEGGARAVALAGLNDPFGGGPDDRGALLVVLLVRNR